VRSMCGLHRGCWHIYMAMGIWVMDCVFARPEHRLREEAQAYEKWQLVIHAVDVQSYGECGVIGSSD